MALAFLIIVIAITLYIIVTSIRDKTVDVFDVLVLIALVLLGAAEFGLFK